MVRAAQHQVVERRARQGARRLDLRFDDGRAHALRVCAGTGSIRERCASAAVGNNANQYQALQSNRTQVCDALGAATWQAQAAGYTLLGTQQREVAQAWPSTSIR